MYTFKEINNNQSTEIMTNDLFNFKRPYSIMKNHIDFQNHFVKTVFTFLSLIQFISFQNLYLFYAFEVCYD